MNTHQPIPRTSFVEEVLRLYRELADTPDRPRRADRLLAAQLERDLVPLQLVRAAILLGSARRRFGYRQLSKIRSLHYFLPVLEELCDNPPDPAYVNCLEQRLRATLDGDQPRISPSSRGLP